MVWRIIPCKPGQSPGQAFERAASLWAARCPFGTFEFHYKNTLHESHWSYGNCMRSKDVIIY